MFSPFPTTTPTPPELSALVGIIAAKLACDPDILEALHIAELNSLDSTTALEVAVAIVLYLNMPIGKRTGMFIVHDDGRDEARYLTDGSTAEHTDADDHDGHAPDLSRQFPARSCSQPRRLPEPANNSAKSKARGRRNPPAAQ